MKNSLTKSGMDIIGDVPWGMHICQFYHTKEELIDILVPFFKAGLENNELCFWVTSQPLEVEDAIGALRKVIPDLNVYQKKGQIEIISYKEWFLTEGIFDPERVLNCCVEKLTYALHNGYEGFRLSGNTSWLRKEDWNSFLIYKEKSNNIIGNYHMIALSTYSLEMHSVDEIIQLGVNHQFTLVKSEGKWKSLESSKRKMAGETEIKATIDWENTFDAIPDLIAIIDTNNKIVRVNRAMASKMGMTPEECIGLTCYHVVHGTTKPPSFCPQGQMLKDGFEHTSEVCEDCLGGYFIVSVSPLHDSEGKLTGSIHVAHDINKRKQMEEALRESEEKYRNLIETANEGIGIVNADFKIIYINKKMKEMFGRSTEESIGRSIWDSMSEESKAMFKPNLERNWQDLNGSLEIKHIRKDGSPMWAQVNAKSLYDKDGKFAGALGMLTDITERKKIEEKLRESEEKYRNIVETANEGIFIMSAELKITYANRRTAEMLGYTLEETIGRPIVDFVREECLPFAKRNFKKRLRGINENYELKLKCKDGSAFWAFLSGRALFDMDGKFTGTLGMLTDITERKEAEEALKRAHDNLEEKIEERTTQLEKAYNSLKEKEESLSEAQKMAHIGNWDWNLITGKMYWSDEMCRIFGLNPAKFGSFYSEVLSCTHPDDREHVDNAVKSALKGQSFAIDHRLVLASGEERTVHAHGDVVYDEKNEPVRMRGTVQDITERIKSEEKIRNFANIVESSNDAIGTISLDGNITSWNRGAEQVYSYSAEEILGKPVSILAPTHLLDETKKLSERIKSGESINNYETLRLRKDGKALDVSMTLSPVYDLHRKMIAISFISRDITKRIEAEKALANFEAAREKEIHHRIKNNLQVVSSLLDLQAYKFKGRNDITDSEVIDAFIESENRVISMALIHEELYNGGRFDIINFSAYVERLVENILSTYRFGDADVSLNKDLEEDLFFEMDIAIPLGTIINEIISNSFKHAFSGRDKGEIRIKMHREENVECIKSIYENCRSTTCALTISDNGVGIPENLDFKKLDSLGILLVTSLVDQLDGKLEIKRNNGTQFTIRFTIQENNNHTSTTKEKKLPENWFG